MPGFLSLLTPCLSEECDFIASVGAGDTIEDFIGRMEKIAEFFTGTEIRGIAAGGFQVSRTRKAA